MKIVLLYSGHLRSIHKTIDNHIGFKNALVEGGNDVKIFCQTWADVESETQSWWNLGGKNDSEVLAPAEILVSLLAPNEFIVSKKQEFNSAPEFFNSLISYEGISSMFYALKQSYLIYERYSERNSWIADVVIRIRYDIEFDFADIVDKIIDVTKEKKLLAISSKTYNYLNSYSDLLFVLPSDHASKLFNTFDCFNNISVLKKYFSKYKHFLPEIFVSEYVMRNSKVELLFSRVTILRMNGDLVEVSMIDKESQFLFDVCAIVDVHDVIHFNVDEYRNYLKRFLVENDLFRLYKFYIGKVGIVEIIFVMREVFKNGVKNNFLLITVNNVLCRQKKSRNVIVNSVKIVNEAISVLTTPG